MSTSLFHSTLPTPSALAAEVGEWADRNFPGKGNPDLGLMEEMGEATHCYLKRLQGIRGFDVPDYFYEHFSDALADAGVYLLHACHLHSTIFQVVGPSEYRTYPDFRTALTNLNSQIGLYVEQFQEVLDGDIPGNHPVFAVCIPRIWGALELLAGTEEIDLWPMVVQTWAKVKQRDWVKNPANAHLVVDSAAYVPQNQRSADGPSCVNLPVTG